MAAQVDLDGRGEPAQTQDGPRGLDERRFGKIELARDGGAPGVVARSIEETDNEVYERWPEQPADARRLKGTFESFGLPAELAA